MDWTALYKTIGLCLVSILIEAASYTKEGKRWFQVLNKPQYSFSISVWYFVGAVYYILFGIIAYRLFKDASDRSVQISLLVIIMVLNGVGNFILFKYRSTKWFYLVIYPFGLILLTFIILLFPNDITSTALSSIYFVWLIYDLYYAYWLWKLNDKKHKEM